MPKCYDGPCQNFVAEKHTYCPDCQLKHYPTANKSSVSDVQRRLAELAKKAPAKIETPQLAPPPPKTKSSKDKECAMCSKPKKHAIVIKLGFSDYYICWSHKTAMESTYGNEWVQKAIGICAAEQAKKEGIATVIQPLLG